MREEREMKDDRARKSERERARARSKSDERESERETRGGKRPSPSFLLFVLAPLS